MGLNYCQVCARHPSIIKFTVLRWNTEFSPGPFWEFSREIFLSKFSLLSQNSEWRKLKNACKMEPYVMSQVFSEKIGNHQFLVKADIASVSTGQLVNANTSVLQLATWFLINHNPSDDLNSKNQLASFLLQRPLPMEYYCSLQQRALQQDENTEESEVS